MNTMGHVWLWVLIVSSVLYFAVAVFVTIRGAGDLRELFSGGTDDAPEEPSEEHTESAGTQ